jgi:regulatory protein
MGRGERGTAPPLDGAALERLALRYAERYATSRAKLSRYLLRKTRERGWDGKESEPPIEAIVTQMARLGYVDDRAFAAARAETLSRRGLGARRIAADLQAAGIGAEDSAGPCAQAEAEAFSAALTYARKRKIGPYAAVAADRERRQRALGVMLRAGHPFDLARKIVDTAPGEEVDPADR